MKFIGLAAISVLATACNDKPIETKAPEPVDVQATERINHKLLNSMRKISEQQLDQVEDAGKDALQLLAESDRQELIDLTIEESSEAVLESGDKMLRLLEDINGISE
ncbi:MAG: hypothetical protein JKX81_06150 [Arenicella sp.]|nr:hypothetical protein [Arenicella sp.]